MKKASVAIGIVAVLGIAYVGSTWYSGSLIEDNIDEQITAITKHLNSNKRSVRFNLIKSHYEKNLFSSKFHLKVTLSQQPKYQSEASDDDQLTLFEDDITIHHGPFPLAALAKGNFTPQLALIEYQMSEKKNPDLWKKAGNQPPLTGYITIDYNSNNQINLITKGGELTHNEIPSLSPDVTIEYGESSINLFSKNHGHDMGGNIKSDNFSINANNESKLSISQFEASLSSPNGLGLQDFEINIGKLFQRDLTEFPLDALSVDVELYDILKLENFKAKGRVNGITKDIEIHNTLDKLVSLSEEEPDLVLSNIDLKQIYRAANDNQLPNGSLQMKIESINYGQQHLGKLIFDIDFSDSNDLFVRKLVSLGLGAIESNHASVPNNPNIALNIFNFHSDAGDLNFSFKIKQLSLGSIKTFLNDTVLTKIKLEAPFAVLDRFVTQVSNPDSSDVTDEQLFETNKIIDSLLHELEDSPIVDIKQGSNPGIYSDIEIHGNKDKIRLNNHFISKEEFLQFFESNVYD